MKKGKFIVIDGIDGSGKATQLKELAKRLSRAGRMLKTFDFPQYGKESSYFVSQYLNGKYGKTKEVGPYRASIFYAMDRFDVGEQIKRWLKEGYVVISNRYVSANMGHQGSKISNPAAQKKYFRWLDNLEYGLLEIPKPDITVILHVTPRISQELVDKKGNRAYVGGTKRDIHEADLGHLRRAEQTYLRMIKTFPRDFRLVECVQNGKIIPVGDIAERVWQTVKPVLK
ncbi:MAG: hypothetical protein V1856_01605 [Candidatus Liptonbacteria bacterium]